MSARGCAQFFCLIVVVHQCAFISTGYSNESFVSIAPTVPNGDVHGQYLTLRDYINNDSAVLILLTQVLSFFLENMR